MAIAEARRTKEAEDAAPEAAASSARAASHTPDASAAASAATGAGADAEAAPEGASVWNKGGYHWEERDLTVWAKERLTALLMDVEIDVPGGLLTIAEVKEVKGDASSSMRKGAHIVFYEFKMKLAWEGEIVDGEGTTSGVTSRCLRRVRDSTRPPLPWQFPTVQSARILKRSARRRGRRQGHGGRRGRDREVRPGRRPGPRQGERQRPSRAEGRAKPAPATTKRACERCLPFPRR